MAYGMVVKRNQVSVAVKSPTKSATKCALRAFLLIVPHFSVHFGSYCASTDVAATIPLRM
jgi:hypothetical protein